MKDIWKKFSMECKAAWEDFKTGLSKTLKTTFDILKDGCIYFVTAIFKWLKELFVGIVFLLKSLFEIIWAAFILAISSTVGLLYEKIVDWIKGW